MFNYNNKITLIYCSNFHLRHQTDATTPSIVWPSKLGVVLRPFARRIDIVAKSLTGFTFCATAPSNTQQRNMQQGADATRNMQQCWVMLANNVVSVSMWLYFERSRPTTGGYASPGLS